MVILKRRLICIISISFHFIFAPLYNIYSSHPLFTFSTFYFIYFKVKFEARFNLSTRCYLNFTLLSFQLNDNLLIFVPYYFSFSFHIKITRNRGICLLFLSVLRIHLFFSTKEIIQLSNLMHEFFLFNLTVSKLFQFLDLEETQPSII